MAAVLKTASRGDLARGFESHALRFLMSQDIQDTTLPLPQPVAYAIDLPRNLSPTPSTPLGAVDGVADMVPVMSMASPTGRPEPSPCGGCDEWSARRGDVANVVGGEGLGTIIRLGGLCVVFCQRSEVACRGRRLFCSSG